MVANIFSSILLGSATDLTNHDDSLCLAILLEKLETLYEICTLNRVTAYAYTGTLPQAVLRSLKDRLISQCPGARYDTNRTGFVNRSRHNSNLALTGRDHTGTVGTNKTCII